MKKRFWLLGAATMLLTFGGGLMANNTVNSAGNLTAYAAKPKYKGKSGGMKVYKTGNVLSGVTSRGYKTVKVRGGYKANTSTSAYDKDASYSKYMVANHLQTSYNYIKSKKHAGANYSFKTAAFLPIEIKNLRDYTMSPQGIAFSKNGKELFILYTKGGTTSDWSRNKKGFIIRYDYAKLKSAGAVNGKGIGQFRKAALDVANHSATAKEKQIMSYAHVGPTFATGHGQAFALNRKTNELWLTRDKTAGKCLVERVNQSSLKPDEAINFSLGSSQTMGAELAFDKNGYAYFWTITKTAWPTAPKGTVKIYRGKIGTSSTYFKLVKRGLSAAPGKTFQSMGYNPNNNRLFLVSDEGLTSIPANKLDKLSAKYVDQNRFSGSREFEGLAFNPAEKGSKNGYLLSNRGPELLKMY